MKYSCNTKTRSVGLNFERTYTVDYLQQMTAQWGKVINIILLLFNVMFQSQTWYFSIKSSRYWTYLISTYPPRQFPKKWMCWKSVPRFVGLYWDVLFAISMATEDNWTNNDSYCSFYIFLHLFKYVQLYSVASFPPRFSPFP